MTDIEGVLYQATYSLMPLALSNNSIFLNIDKGAVKDFSDKILSFVAGKLLSLCPAALQHGKQ
jgi:hypothetical protein